MIRASTTRQRKLRAATQAADAMIQADAAYFRRFASRQHRVRLASGGEMAANALAAGRSALPAAPGQRWFAAVKQIAPGVRCRVFLQNDADSDTDLSEWQAAYVYNLIATPGSKARQLEERLLAAIAKRGRP